MNSTASGAIDALNSLLTGSRDGAQNYRDAADAVQRADLKAALGDFATATLVERSWAVIQRQHDQVAQWSRQDPGRTTA